MNYSIVSGNLQVAYFVVSNPSTLEWVVVVGHFEAVIITLEGRRWRPRNGVSDLGREKLFAMFRAPEVEMYKKSRNNVIRVGTRVLGCCWGDWKSTLWMGNGIYCESLLQWYLSISQLCAHEAEMGDGWWICCWASVKKKIHSLVESHFERLLLIWELWTANGFFAPFTAVKTEEETPTTNSHVIYTVLWMSD